MSPRLGRPRFGSKSGPAGLDGAAAAAPDTAQESVASEAAAWAASPAADAEAPAPDAPAPEELAPVAAAGEPEAPAPSTIAEGLVALATYQRAVLSWVAEDGYPVNVDIEIEVKPGEGIVRFGEPAGFHVPPGTTVAITGSHITLLPGGGFGERRHVTAWGVASARPRARFAANVTRVWVWDEDALPLPAAYERSLRKARRYFDRLSAERGERVRPRLPRQLLLLRATRAPFLSATFAPVLLGLAVAARVGVFDALTAVITVVAACAVHLGLNVANDVFDTLQGADDANATPTKFSGGSRVLQNALVTIREMSMLAVGCYVVAAILGVLLLVMRGSPALIVIAIVGFFISVAYTMPPFKLVYRGLGEIATAIGFGPVMLLGAYVVQSRGSLKLEAFVVSIPVALLVAMILYVNEIPDRAGDAKAGKRTLPVRWSKAAVIAGFDVAAAGSFVAVAAGVAAAVLPIPALLALLAIPVALRVHEGLVRFYDNPYALMSAMGANIQLHLAVGSLLFVGYLLTIADQTLLQRAPFLW
jgi:1,4-dihydroxy-2-naphthoate polyprenyltransferase